METGGMKLSCSSSFILRALPPSMANMAPDGRGPLVRIKQLFFVLKCTEQGFLSPARSTNKGLEKYIAVFL